MATTTTKPDLEVTTPFTGAGVPAWPQEQGAPALSDHPAQDPTKPSHRDALQALLAFSALHDQVRRRKTLAARTPGFDAGLRRRLRSEFEQDEQFVLDEVLQLVAERAVAITGADGLAIALAENNEIVLRAAAGTVRPDVGARIDRDSAFSGACFRTAQIVNCDDTETDPRVNLQACRKLGARSMVAVPLCGRRRVIGVLEAFSAWPFGFNESDIRNLSLLAELVLGALKPEDEDRFARVGTGRGNQAGTAPLRSTAQHNRRRQNRCKQSSSRSGCPASRSAPVVPVQSLLLRSLDPSLQKSPITCSGRFSVRSQAAGRSAKSYPLRRPASLDKSAVELYAEAQNEPSQPKLADSNQKSPPRNEVRKPAEPVASDSAGGHCHCRRVCRRSLVENEDGACGQRHCPQSKDCRRKHSQTEPRKPPQLLLRLRPDERHLRHAISDANEPANSPATAQELSKFPRVTGIRHWSSADSSTVVLDLEDQVQYEAHRLAGPDRIYFDLRDTQLAPELIGKSIDVGDTLREPHPHGTACGGHDAHCS